MLCRASDVLGKGIVASYANLHSYFFIFQTTKLKQTIASPPLEAALGPHQHTPMQKHNPKLLMEISHHRRVSGLSTCCGTNLRPRIDVTCSHSRVPAFQNPRAGRIL